ncbi:MAG: MopE-related protein [Myxococcota bacterium]
MRTLTPLLALAFVLPACAPEDADGDGVAALLDCDDANAAVFPGANEICDGIDNDCSGVVDDDYARGGSLFFLDRDGDGYGVWEMAKTACSAPTGYVTTSTDCADDDADTHPGAPEFCDKLDQNCNGELDDDAVDGTAYYSDLDLDGYGGINSIQLACEQPDGYITVGGDCEDFNPAINPEAAERCDLIDNDCNGVVDDADSLEATTWYADADRDGFGSIEDTIQSCNQPEYYEPLEKAGDCNDADATINPGADEICNDGIDNNCNDSADACSFENWDEDSSALLFKGTGSSAYWGRDTAIVGDIDGDGYDDYAVGGYRSQDSVCTGSGSSYCGSAALMFGGPITKGFSRPEVDAADGVQYGVPYRYSYAGMSVAGLGDLNGDGYDDFGFGAYGYGYTNSYQGGVFVQYGGPTLQSKIGTNVNSEAELGLIFGQNSSDYLGYGLSKGGDFNGDGYDDLVMSASRARNPSNQYTGVVYIRYSDSSKLSFEAAADLPGLTGETNYQYLGSQTGHGVSSTDLDGDGLADLIVGADRTTVGGRYSAGTAYLVYGAGEELTGRLPIKDVASAQLSGSVNYQYFGGAVSGLQDINGDGYEEVAVCGYGAASYAGQCSIFFGGTDRLSGAYDLNEDYDLAMTGTGSSFYGGWYGLTATDLDNDGIAELVFPMPSWRFDTSVYGEGAVAIVKGSAELEGLLTEDDVTVLVRGGGARYSYFGGGVGGESGDVNGDGYADLLIGSYGANSYAGTASLFLGGGI